MWPEAYLRLGLQWWQSSSCPAEILPLNLLCSCERVDADREVWLERSRSVINVQLCLELLTVFHSGMSVQSKISTSILPDIWLANLRISIKTRHWGNSFYRQWWLFYQSNCVLVTKNTQGAHKGQSLSCHCNAYCMLQVNRGCINNQLFGCARFTLMCPILHALMWANSPCLKWRSRPLSWSALERVRATLSMDQPLRVLWDSTLLRSTSATSSSTLQAIRR